MRVVVTVALLVSVLGASRSWARADLRVVCVPPVIAEGGVALAVDAAVEGTDPREIATAEVVVLTPRGERAFPLFASAGRLWGEIPAELVVPPEIRYYVRVADLSGDVVTAPPGAPTSAPYSTAVAAPETAPASLDPGIVVVTPQPGEVVPGRLPEVAAILDPPLAEPWMAVVLLDGHDVTASADVVADHFYLAPFDSLADGEHSVTFSALDAARSIEATWSFFVRTAATPAKAPFSSAGTASGRALDAGAASTVTGSLEVGWAVVEAETTAVESLDVFLPYEETSAPTLDLYASALGPSGGWTASLRYDPLYDDRLNGSVLAGTAAVEVEAGDIFPSLTPTTMDWASGLGARASVSVGATRTEVVVLRLSEADTVGGLGVYARNALGAKETVAWSGASASVAYLHAFDDTGTVAVDDRIADPMRNDVLAAVLSLRSGRRLFEAEAAGSWSEGDAEGRGGCVRARASYEKDYANRVSVEYARADTAFFSAGSIALQPGRESVAVEAAFSPGGAVGALATAEVYRTRGTATGIDPDAPGTSLFGRADVRLAVGGGEALCYALGRYDRTPYEDSDYHYVQTAAGGSFRRGPLSSSLSLSWSRTAADGESDATGIGGDVKWDVVPGRLRASVSGRWTFGSGDEDYTRTTHTWSLRYAAGPWAAEAEYRRAALDDRTAPEDGYTEHVGLLSLATRF